MFWKTKSTNEKLLDAAQEQREHISLIAKLQSNDLRYSLIGKLLEEDLVFKKVVSYVYYDGIASVISQKLAGSQHDVLKGYLRDAALAELEKTEGEQCRTYAATVRSYAELEKIVIHPLNLLQLLESTPVFDAILRTKVEEKVIEVRTFWGMEGFGQKIKSHLGDLVSDEELKQSTKPPTEIKKISCGSCSVSELLEDVNVREDAKLYLYNSNERRTTDDLEIYSSICFDCGAITEFSFDPYNFSGNATEGIEYFRSYPVDRNSLKSIFEIMRNSGHLKAILRLVSKHPDKVV